MLTSDDLVGLLRTIARLSNQAVTAEELRKQRDGAIAVGQWLVAEAEWCGSDLQGP